jgi:hypothetical protein
MELYLFFPERLHGEDRLDSYVSYVLKRPNWAVPFVLLHALLVSSSKRLPQ